MSSFRVGIAGGSCSGKSTFALALRTALQPVTCEIVTIDRFMLQERGPKITLSTGEEHPNNNHPLSTDNEAVLQAVRGSRAQVVLIEGLMALHLEEIRSLLDLSIFVELDPAARAVRRIVRNIERKPELDPAWIGRYYLECAVPGHREFVEPSRAFADFVVRGDGDVLRIAGLVASLVRSKLPARS
jgi:uridine kinase